MLHPHDFGLASHLGVLADIPTIGVGKTIMGVDGLHPRWNKKYVPACARARFLFPPL